MLLSFAADLRAILGAMYEEAVHETLRYFFRLRLRLWLTLRFLFKVSSRSLIIVGLVVEWSKAHACVRMATVKFHMYKLPSCINPLDYMAAQSFTKMK